MDKEVFDYKRITKDQINMLKNRGITINDYDFAEKKLMEVSGTVLLGYGKQWIVRETGKYHPGTSFENLWDVYTADRRVKNFLLNYLAGIEISLRNIVGSVLSKKYGSTGYLDPKNFKDPDHHDQFLKDIDRELYKESEPYVRYYKEKYGDEFPIYIAVELISFGTLSKLYSNMKRQDQKIVSERYNVKSERVLASFFYSFTEIRNTCAHHGRLYNRNFDTACAIYKSDKDRLESLEPEFTLNQHRLFINVLAMSHILEKDKREKLIKEFQNVFNDYPIYELNRINFPKCWKTILYRAD